MPDSNQVEYMAFPRGAAVAETGWSPAEKKNYTEFKERMIQQFKRYDGIGWNYSKAILTEIE
jgi:hexosaminidase